MDTTTAIQYEATPARPPPPPEALERMLQAASYGAQVLDAAAKRVIPEPPRPPADRPPEEGEGDAAAARSRQVRHVRLPSAFRDVSFRDLMFGGWCSLRVPARMATQSENPPATEGQTCLGCSATSTPEWRRGPMG